MEIAWIGFKKLIILDPRKMFYMFKEFDLSATGGLIYSYWTQNGDLIREEFTPRDVDQYQFQLKLTIRTYLQYQKKSPPWFFILGHAGRVYWRRGTPAWWGINQADPRYLDPFCDFVRKEILPSVAKEYWLLCNPESDILLCNAICEKFIMNPDIITSGFILGIAYANYAAAKSSPPATGLPV